MNSSGLTDQSRVCAPKDVAVVAQRLNVPFKHIRVNDHIDDKLKRRYKSSHAAVHAVSNSIQCEFREPNTLLLLTERALELLLPQHKDADAVVKYDSFFKTLDWNEFSIASLTNIMNPNDSASDQECCVCLDHPRFGIFMRCLDCSVTECAFCTFKIMTRTGKFELVDEEGHAQRKCPQCSRVDTIGLSRFYPFLMEEMNIMSDEQKHILHSWKAVDSESNLRITTWNKMKRLKEDKVARIVGLSKAEEYNGKFAMITEHQTRRSGVFRWGVRLFDPSKGEFTDTTTLYLKSQNLEVDCISYIKKLSDIKMTRKD